MPIDPPNATLVIERPVQVSLDHGLTRELTNRKPYVINDSA